MKRSLRNGWIALAIGLGIVWLYQAWGPHEQEEVHTEVIRLSRINSNVKALALSMGQKRRVTARCEEILATLRDTIDSRGSKATR